MTPEMERLTEALDIAERLRATTERVAARLDNVLRLHARDPRLDGACCECFQPWPCRCIGAAMNALPPEAYPKGDR